GGGLVFRAEEPGVPALAWIVDVGALMARLEDALRYAPQVEWVDAPPPAALTIVTEGRASTSRAEFGVQFEVTPYPHHAIAARLDCEKAHGHVARQWFANGEILALLPLGAGTQRRRAGDGRRDRRLAAAVRARGRSLGAPAQLGPHGRGPQRAGQELVRPAGDGPPLN